MIVVPDAGPLIYLAGAGQLTLLPALYDEVVVPRVVWDEVTVAGAGLVGAAEVLAVGWLRIEDVTPDPTLALVLDRGEAAAIPLAERLHATLSWTTLMLGKWQSPAVWSWSGRSAYCLSRSVVGCCETSPRSSIG